MNSNFIKFDNTVIEGSYSQIAEHILNLPVLVFTVSSRGGSIFFHSLIEDNLEILNIPLLSTFWDYSIDNKENAGEIIAERFIARCPELFCTALSGIHRWDSLGAEANQYVKVDKEIFIKNFIELSKTVTLSEKNIFFLIHGAYSITCRKDPLKAKILFYHMHTPEKYPFNFFPKDLNFKMLHITRDPRNGLVRYQESVNKNTQVWHKSGINYFGKDVYLNPKRIYVDFENIISQIQIFKEFHNKTYLITLEDLHEKKEELLNKVLSKFGLSQYSENIKSTFWGLQWHADLRSDTTLTGFQDGYRNNNFKRKLNFIDIFLIEFLTYYRSNKQGHKTIFRFSKFSYYFMLPFVFFISLIPMSYELRSIKKNIKNRSFRNLSLNFYSYICRQVFSYKWILKTLFNKIYYPKQIK